MCLLNFVFILAVDVFKGSSNTCLQTVSGYSAYLAASNWGTCQAPVLLKSACRVFDLIVDFVHVFIILCFILENDKDFLLNYETVKEERSVFNMRSRGRWFELVFLVLEQDTLPCA